MAKIFGTGKKLTDMQRERLIKYAEIRGLTVEVFPWGEVKVYDDYTSFYIVTSGDVEWIFGRNGARAIL